MSKKSILLPFIKRLHTGVHSTIFHQNTDVNIIKKTVKTY